MCTICDLGQTFASKAQTTSNLSRRRFIASGLAAGAAIAAGGIGDALADTATADVVFVNGKVYTVGSKRPWAQAVAVKGRRIAYVGDTAGAKAFIGRRTEVIDLRGKMLIPGFVEAHTHPYVGSAYSQ